jgi:hypothetical protein
MTQAGRSQAGFSLRSLDFSIDPNPSSRTMALGSSQPLTEMNTRNLPGGKGQSAHKADNLTAICEPIVLKMWKPRRLTTLWTFTVCYKDSFTLLLPYNYYKTRTYTLAENVTRCCLTSSTNWVIYHSFITGPRNGANPIALEPIFRMYVIHVNICHLDSKRTGFLQLRRVVPVPLMSCQQQTQFMRTNLVAITDQTTVTFSEAGTR